MGSDFVSTINRIWPQIDGQVTGYFSTALFDSFNNRGNPTAAASFAITLSIVYLSIEPLLRKPFKFFTSQNTLWEKILYELGDVFYRFFLFILIQYTNSYISRGLSDTILNVTVYQRVSEMLIITFLLVTIYTLLKVFGDALKDRKDYRSISINNFNRAYSGIYGVVIQFFSRTFFDIMRSLTTDREIVITAIVTFVLYLILEYYARILINFMDPGQLNRPVWDKILLEYLDFLYTFAIFFIIQYIGVFITAQLENLSIFGEIVGAFLIFITFYSFMALIVKQTSYLKKDKIWFVTDTTQRMWPRISGTVTGLIASIFSDRLLVTEDEQRILLYLVIVILIYSLLDPLIRKIMRQFQTEEERKSTWNAILIEILDFFFSLGLLLFLNSFTDIIALDQTPLLQAIVVIIASQSILSSILIIFRELS